MKSLILGMTLLSLAFVGCNQECEPNYGIGRRAVYSNTEPDPYTTSSSGLEPASGGAGIFVAAVFIQAASCLESRAGCGKGLKIDGLRPGENRVIERAPCTGRPFPTSTEGVLTLGQRPPGIEMGFVERPDGTEVYEVRATPDICENGCSRRLTVPIAIEWLPLWGADPFAETIEYSVFRIDLEVD